MKSSERCASNFQGDRCKARAGHLTQPDDTTPEELRPFHFSNFSVWDAEGKTVGKALGAEIRPGHRRHRVANRVFRELTQGYMRGFKRSPAEAIETLGKLEKFYGGVQ